VSQVAEYVAVFLIAESIVMLLPSFVAGLWRKNNPEMEAKIAVAKQHGGMKDLGREIGLRRRLDYPEHFFSFKSRMMIAVASLIVAAVLIVISL
jgi:hypothetical protein